MNRLKMTLVLVPVLTVLSIATTIWSFATLSSKQINDNAQLMATLPHPTPPKIVDLSPNEHWINPVGMTMAFWFRVNISNYDSKALDGLTLNLTITNVSTDMYKWGTQEPIGTIQPGETTTVKVYVLTELYILNQVSGNTAIVQIISGDKVLDKDSLPLPKWG